MEHLKISIVTPNFNGEAFLDATLRSVLNQNYPDLDYVMIDGASTDGSLDIIEKYKARLSKFVSEPDKGHGDALAKGFALTTGDVMGWINSDDVLLPGSLHQINAIFRQNPEIDWITGRPTSLIHTLADLKVYPVRTWSRLRFLKGHYRWIQQESTFWRRSLWEKAGGLNPALKLTNDFDLWLRFFRHAELHSVNATLGSFRFREGQRSIAFRDEYEQEAKAQIEQEFATLTTEYKKQHGLPERFTTLSHAEAAARNAELSVHDPKPLRLHTQPDNLLKFKNIHKGKRCFVMGNGPSLNKTNLDLLENEIVFGCNGVFLLFDRIAWRPHYYTCVDARVLPDRAPDIERMLTQNPQMTAFLPTEIQEASGDKRHTIVRDIISAGDGRYFFKETQNSLDNPPYSMFSGDINKCVVQPYTVSITMLQLAAYMGFSEIYLIGCDTSYSVPPTTEKNSFIALTSTADDDPNHFDPSYFGKGRKWHDPQVDMMMMHHAHAKTFLDSSGVKVFNATIGGNLEVYPRVDYESLFIEKHARAVSAKTDVAPRTSAAKTGLSAVVVPLTPREVPRALYNLRIWNTSSLDPGSSAPLEAKPMLVFSFNCAADADIERRLTTAFEEADRVRKAFKGISVHFCDLPPEKDAYIRDTSLPPPALGYKSGPNWLFYETFASLRGLGGFIFQMETDCTPIKPNWLRALDEVCRSNEDAWVVGSPYRGRGPLDQRYARHLNGNALYHVGSQAYWQFLSTVLWPWMHEHIRVKPDLPYDCAWDIFITRAELEDPNHRDWATVRRYAHRFKMTEAIVNIGGSAELDGTSIWTASDILALFPSCAVVHGPLSAPAPRPLLYGALPRPAIEISGACRELEASRFELSGDLVRDTVVVPLRLPDGGLFETDDLLTLSFDVQTSNEDAVNLGFSRHGTTPFEGAGHVAQGAKSYAISMTHTVKSPVNAFRLQLALARPSPRACEVQLQNLVLSVRRGDVEFVSRISLDRELSREALPTIVLIPFSAHEQTDVAAMLEKLASLREGIPAHYQLRFTGAPAELTISAPIRAFMREKSASLLCGKSSIPVTAEVVASLNADKHSYLTLNQALMEAILGFDRFITLTAAAAPDAHGWLERMWCKSSDSPVVAQLGTATIAGSRIATNFEVAGSYDGRALRNLSLTRAFTQKYENPWWRYRDEINAPSFRELAQQQHVSAANAGLGYIIYSEWQMARSGSADPKNWRWDDIESSPSLYDTGAEPPRLLLIDMTPIGLGTATGELKASYFADWPAHKLQHLYVDAGQMKLATARNRAVAIETIEILEQALREFQPQVILYRPVSDHQQLHATAMVLIDRLNLPLAVWLMDDWPERLRATDPARGAQMDGDLRALLKKAGVRLAISEAMATAFGERYGVTFDILRNGVCAADWPPRPPAIQSDSLLLRYAGGLAPDTTRDSVHDIARVVSKLSATHRIRLEIRTQRFWLHERARFAALPGVTIEVSGTDAQEYRAWLQGADALLLAYNFDEDTRRYLRYSFANKAPECLVSGAAVLAYGPRDIATLQSLTEAQVVERVDQRSDAAIEQAILRLLNADHRGRLAQRGRAHALAAFNLPHQRAQLRYKLADAAGVYSSGQQLEAMPLSPSLLPQPTATAPFLAPLSSGKTTPFPAKKATVVLLGNAPSLRGFDFKRLEGFDTIGLNAAYRHWETIGFRPSYYACLDEVVGLSHKQGITKLMEMPGAPRQFLLRDNLYRALGASLDERPQVQNFDWLRETFDLLKVQPITTGSHAALWAALLGYREIVIMGVDANYVEEVATAKPLQGPERVVTEHGANPNYYFDDYQRVGDRFNKPNAEADVHLRAWQETAAQLAQRGVRVWNASPNSKLGVFERRPFESFELHVRERATRTA